MVPEGPAAAPLAPVTVLPTAAPQSVAVCVADGDAPPAALTEGWADTWSRFDAVVVVRDVATAASVLARLGGPPEPAGEALAPVTPLPLEPAPGLVIDRAGYRATWQGTDLGLTPHERELLACLLSEPRRAWAHPELYRAVWGGGWFGDPGTVHSTVKRLRAKLRAAGASGRIDSVRGVGFVLRG